MDTLKIRSVCKRMLDRLTVDGVRERKRKEENENCEENFHTSNEFSNEIITSLPFYEKFENVAFDFFSLNLENSLDWPKYFSIFLRHFRKTQTEKFQFSLSFGHLEIGRNSI